MNGNTLEGLMDQIADVSERARKYGREGKVKFALNGFVSGHIYGFNERSQIAWVNLVISTVLRIKKEEKRRDSQMVDWNWCAAAVDELQIEGERRKSEPLGMSVTVTSRPDDSEKGPSTPPRVVSDSSSLLMRQSP